MALIAAGGCDPVAGCTFWSTRGKNESVHGLSPLPGRMPGRMHDAVWINSIRLSAQGLMILSNSLTFALRRPTPREYINYIYIYIDALCDL